MESSRNFNLFMSFLFVSTGTAATLLNLLLLYVIIWGRQSRKSPIQLLLVNLCVCDLYVSAIIHPYSLVNFLDIEFTLTSPVLCKLVNFANSTVAFASVFTLTAISLQRSVYVKDILKVQASSESRREFTKRCIKILIFLWILAFVSAAPIALSYHISSAYSNTTLVGLVDDDGYCSKNWRKALLVLLSDPISDNEVFAAELSYSLLLILIMYLLPMGLIAYAYYHICRLITSTTTILTCPSDADDDASRSFMARQKDRRRVVQLNRSKRIFNLSVILVVIFAVFWLPFHMLNLILDVITHTRALSGINYQFYKDLYFFFMWLALSNSVANPSFLFATDATFRRCLRLLLAPRGCGPHVGQRNQESGSYDDEIQSRPSDSDRGHFEMRERHEYTEPSSNYPC